MEWWCIQQGAWTELRWALSASPPNTGVNFCPQAWFLQRCRLPVSAETEARRRAGSQTHRAIGRQTDLVRAASAAQTVLLLAIGAILLLLAALALRGLA
jgi:hypothetical protein